MNIQQFLSKLSREALIELSQAETVDRLHEAVAALGHTFTVEEAEVAFAALYLLRDSGINDDALEAVCGAELPAPIRTGTQPTIYMRQKELQGGAYIGFGYLHSNCFLS